MTAVTTGQEIESKVSNLYEHSYATTITHFAAAGFLVFTLWFTVDTDIIFKWISVLVCALLVSVLAYSLFNRKRTSEAIDYPLWENYLAASSCMLSIVFAAGYSYAIQTSDASLLAVLTLTLVMQLSCILLPVAGSLKVMALTAFPLILPVIVSLLFSPHPIALVLAIAVITYSLVLVLVSLALYRTVKTSFALESEYAKTLDLVGKYKQKLATSTIEDPQTQILNRRFFDFISGEEIRRAKRANNSLTIAIIAIDAFDEYFKHYGQAKAAKCLRSVAKLLAKAAPRGGEYVMRFDESKFVLLAPNIKTSETIAFTSKMMDIVCGASFEHIHSTVEEWETISISIGVSEYKPGDLIGVEAMIDQASFALKTAKQDGGNCTRLFALDFENEDIASVAEEELSSPYEQQDSNNHQGENISSQKEADYFEQHSQPNPHHYDFNDESLKSKVNIV